MSCVLDFRIAFLGERAIDERQRVGFDGDREFASGRQAHIALGREKAEAGHRRRGVAAHPVVEGDRFARLGRRGDLVPGQGVDHAIAGDDQQSAADVVERVLGERLQYRQGLFRRLQREGVDGLDFLVRFLGEEFLQHRRIERRMGRCRRRDGKQQDESRERGHGRDG